MLIIIKKGMGHLPYELKFIKLVQKMDMFIIYENRIER